MPYDVLMETLIVIIFRIRLQKILLPFFLFLSSFKFLRVLDFVYKVLKSYQQFQCFIKTLQCAYEF